MESVSIKEKFKDEIWGSSKESDVDRLIAYWDYELECYIYLSDEVASPE